MSLAIGISHAKLLAALVALPSAPRFVIVGAAAVHHHVPLQRTTADVDLVIAAPPDDIHPLLSSLGWRRDKSAFQRWRDDEDNIVDALPATPELIRRGRIRFEGEGHEMSLVGFDLALKHVVAVPLRHDPSVVVDVADLPPLVVLKMVAWLDRPHERRKDLGDLLLLFDGALAPDDGRRWEEPLRGTGYDDQAPRFVGEAVRAIAGGEHLAKVHAFLAAILDDAHDWPAVMAREGGYAGDDPEDRVRRRLSAFERGLASAT